MYTFLLVLLALDSVVLIAVILMQAGQGGGMAATFGGASSSAGTIFGTRQAGNLLTKTSWWGGAIFLFLAFLLSLASTRSRAPRSILDQSFPTQTAPAPVQQQPAGGVQLNPVTPTTTPAAPPATQPPAGTKKQP
jgi:preprotein translocase subunit SecG